MKCKVKKHERGHDFCSRGKLGRESDSEGGKKKEWWGGKSLESAVVTSDTSVFQRRRRARLCFPCSSARSAFCTRVEALSQAATCWGMEAQGGAERQNKPLSSSAFSVLFDPAQRKAGSVRVVKHGIQISSWAAANDSSADYYFFFQLWNCFFCPTSCPKLTDSSCTVINDKHKQQIITFKKLRPGNVWHLCLK